MVHRQIDTDRRHPPLNNYSPLWNLQFRREIKAWLDSIMDDFPEQWGVGSKELPIGCEKWAIFFSESGSNHKSGGGVRLKTF